MTVVATAIHGGAPDAVITVSGEFSISHSVSNGNTATVAISFNLDNSVYKTEGVTVTQIDTAADWLRPFAIDESLYEIKVEKGFLDPNPTSGPALGVWHAFTANRTWTYQNSTDDSLVSATLTAEVREIADTANNDSGAYGLNAMVGLPP